MNGAVLVHALLRAPLDNRVVDRAVGVEQKQPLSIHDVLARVVFEGLGLARARRTYHEDVSFARLGVEPHGLPVCRLTNFDVVKHSAVAS